MPPKTCPKCQSSLEGEDIYEYFKREYGDEEKALETAAGYGWTKENPQRFGRAIGDVDLGEDRVVAWQCPDCNHVWPAAFY